MMHEGVHIEFQSDASIHSIHASADCQSNMVLLPKARFTDLF